MNIVSGSIDSSFPQYATCAPQDVIQYHPRSFEDAESKTYSRRRETCSGRVRNNMDMHHYLPPEYLEDIWRHIIQNAELSELIQFHGLFIVLSAKNIKLAGRSSSFQECRAKVIDHLRQVLDWPKADLSRTWIDVMPSILVWSSRSTKHYQKTVRREVYDGRKDIIPTNGMKIKLVGMRRKPYR